jgi:hypothetical protein
MGFAWIGVALSLRAHAEPPSVAKPASSAGPSASAELGARPPGDREAADLVRLRATIETHRMRLAGTLQPPVRAKLQESIRQASAAASNKAATPGEIHEVARKSVGKTFTQASKGAVEAAALIVLMEAEKDARTESNDIQMRQDALRQARDCRSELACLERLGAKGGTSKEIAAKAIDDVKNQRDSLREIGEADSRRLKLAVERGAKLTAALSALMKKIADTPETITQSLK